MEKFFSRVKTATRNSRVKPNTQIEGWLARYPRSTMVLTSNTTHTPLAALVFRSEGDNDCRALLTARAPPSQQTRPHFQGVLDMPDQPFSLTIVNLWNQAINFNILHTPNYQVKSVDPGPSFGINQVNELYAGQAYTVKADQSHNNCQMILRGLTQTNATTKQEEKVTVQASEEKADAPKGLYFYLSVVGALGDAPGPFTEGSTWQACPWFIRSTAKPQADRPFYDDSYSRLVGSRQSSRFSGSRPDQPIYRALGGSRDNSRGLERTKGPVISGPFERTADGWRRQMMELEDSAPPPPSNDSEMPELEDVDAAGFSFGALATTPPSNNTNAFSFGGGGGRVALEITDPDSVLEVLNDGVPKEEAEDEEMDFDLFGGGDEQREAHHAVHHQVDIGQSQAGALEHGRQLTVHVADTGLEYDYEHPSSPVVLCLSICPGMVYLPMKDLHHRLQEAVKHTVRDEGKAVVATMKTFVSDVDCMDLESPTDTVIVQCGHQCIHHTSIEAVKRHGSCPMCRGPLLGFLPARIFA